MTTYYTNSPSRFGTCYATFDPSVSQKTAVTPPVVTATATTPSGGGKWKFTPFNPGRLIAELEMRKGRVQDAEREALQEVIEEVRAEKPIEVAGEEIRFESSYVEDGFGAELAKRIAEYEAIANEIEQATIRRMRLLEMQRNEEEEIMIMLLAQIQ